VRRNGLWNANIHYHSLLLDAIPADAQRVLDVGCGDGILSAQIAQGGMRHVVGLDLDAGVLERARARHHEHRIEWRNGDVMTIPFEHGSFDAVVSVATLHHLDAEQGLARLAELVKPGGVVALIGLAANDWRDLPYAAVGFATRSAIGLIRGNWAHSAPTVWPPPETYRRMERLASRVLPGSRYRRLPLGRYSLTWKKPLGTGPRPDHGAV
jgi:SAM-dependent methyltransferase